MGYKTNVASDDVICNIRQLYKIMTIILLFYNF